MKCLIIMLKNQEGEVTVDQLMFAAINVRVFEKQTSSLLLMFADSCLEGQHFLQPCFTKVSITPLKMVRFEKFNLDLKVESNGYKFLRAIYVCEFVKITKFANINRARTLVDLQYKPM